MRFLSLDLRNYGPFEQAPVLDLSGDDPGLHIIVGPNEVGKSTALRAIRSLLFDFPRTDPDAHDRSYDAIRLGASIERIQEDGTHRLDFVRRRKGRKLWDFEESKPLPDDALEAFLGETDADTFRDLFSMDHAELVGGGKGIIQGKGRLGEMLFAAGSGMGRLDLVRRSLDDDMGSLFKSRNAVHPAINKTLKSLKQVQEETRSSTLLTSRWEQCDAARARALAQLAQRSVDIRQVDTEIALRGAYRAALGIVPRRLEALDRLAELEGAILLPEEFSETHRRVLGEKRVASHLAGSTRRNIDRLVADIQEAGPPDPVLEALKEIGRLAGDYNAMRDDIALVPVELPELERLQHEADALAARLPAELLHLRPAELDLARERVTQFGQQSVALRTRSEAIEQSLADLQADHPDLIGEGILPENFDLDRSKRSTETLDFAISTTLSEGDLEQKIELAEAALVSARNEAEVSLLGLSLWNGSLEELERLAVPPGESFQVFDEAFRRLDEEIRQLEGRRWETSKRLDALDREIIASASGGSIPSESELDELRATRDRSWASIRGSWIDGRPCPTSPTEMATDYEQQSSHSDEMADRLRNEAGRVAEHAARLRSKAEASDELSGLDLEVGRRAAERDRYASDWLRLWRKIGIEPLSPREMKDWNNVDRVERLQLARDVRKQAEALTSLRSHLVSVRRDLSSALDRAGEPSLDVNESLAAGVDRARMASGRHLRRRDLLRAQASKAQWVADQDQWDRRWVEFARPMGLQCPDPIGPDEAMSILSRVADWTMIAEQVRRKRAFVETCRQQQRQFVEAVDQLRDRLGSSGVRGVSALSIEDDSRFGFSEIERLSTRAEEAQQHRTRLEDWNKRVCDLENDHEHQVVNVAIADQTLRDLAEEANCEVDRLAEAIKRSDDLRVASAELRRLDDQLDLIAGPIGRSVLLRSINGMSITSIADELDCLAERRASIESEMAHLNQQVGSITLELSQMENGPGASGSNQDYHNHLARLGGDVQRLTRLRLASAILDRAVERYRETHQGQILELASSYFERMTDRSFSGLKAEVDEKGLPTLRVLRRNRSTSDGVEILSEGTADQLYLAIRLASLCRWLEDQEPMPFVVDDILVNFDDRRASAALQILAEISSKTQVLFFTHHRHLCDIARNLTPSTAIHLHDLKQ